MGNRKDFLWWTKANDMRNSLVPEFATKAEIKKDGESYWINVWWLSGTIAPLTIQESYQAQGD